MQADLLTTRGPYRRDLTVAVIQQCRLVLAMPASGVVSITVVLPAPPEDQWEQARQACQRLAEEYALTATFTEGATCLTFRLTRNGKERAATQ